MSKPWGFRVASTPSAGGGHLARSCAVISCMTEPVVLFLDPDTPPALRPLIKHLKTRTESGSTCCDSLIEECSSGNLAGVVIDGYHFESSDINACRQHTPLAMFQDDIAQRPCDLAIFPLLSHNLPGTHLNGYHFAPLSQDFRAAHRRAIQRAERAEGRLHLLIAFGQVDSANVTSAALEALKQIGGDIQVTVSLGGGATHLQLIKDQVESISNCIMEVGRESLIPLYESTDIAIGAPGISQLERMCCGIPTILVPQNEIQLHLAERFAESGAAIACAPKSSAIETSLRSLLSHRQQQTQLRTRCTQLIDGRGAKRIAAAIEAGRERRWQ